MITMESEDEAWPLAIGYIAEHLRGKCPFSYGTLINFQTKISAESDLDAFLVFAPPFLTEDEQSVDLGDYICHIAGMYPIYWSEKQLIDSIGLEKFWHLEEWEPFDPKRTRIR